MNITIYMIIDISNNKSKEKHYYFMNIETIILYIT
jgi:hypothetical protein